MSTQQKLSPEAAVVKEVYAALNRNDIPGVLKHFAADIERIEPEGFPSSGTYRGHTDIEAHFSSARDTWAEGACEPEEFITAGDKVIVYVHVKVRIKNKTEWIDARIADGFIVRDGKVTQMRTFLERPQALTWAGL